MRTKRVAAYDSTLCNTGRVMGGVLLLETSRLAHVQLPPKVGGEKGRLGLGKAGGVEKVGGMRGGGG